jgi:hypothetical protein
VGTWTLSGEQIAGAVSSLGLPITLVPIDGGSGVMATVTEDGQWSITGDQSFSVHALDGKVDGDATVQAQASGTYHADDTVITFVLDAVSGSVGFTGTFQGRAVDHVTLSLDAIGALSLYGWTGAARYTCSQSGLQVRFPSFTLDL